MNVRKRESSEKLESYSVHAKTLVEQSISNCTCARGMEKKQFYVKRRGNEWKFYSK